MNNSNTSIEEIAIEAWPPECPVWIIELAKSCDHIGLDQTAISFEIEAVAVSKIIRNDFFTDYTKIKDKVENIVFDKKVVCPILGEIQANKCLDQQARKFSIANSIRVRLYQACRNNCPNSQIGD